MRAISRAVVSNSAMSSNSNKCSKGTTWDIALRMPGDCWSSAELSKKRSRVRNRHDGHIEV